MSLTPTTFLWTIKNFKELYSGGSILSEENAKKDVDILGTSWRIFLTQRPKSDFFSIFVKRLDISKAKMNLSVGVRVASAGNDTENLADYEGLEEGRPKKVGIMMFGTVEEMLGINENLELEIVLLIQLCKQDDEVMNFGEEPKNVSSTKDLARPATLRTSDECETVVDLQLLWIRSPNLANYIWERAVLSLDSELYVADMAMSREALEFVLSYVMHGSFEKIKASLTPALAKEVMEVSERCGIVWLNTCIRNGFYMHPCTARN